jgi:UDP-glucose 4-epimerase
MNKVIVTGGCGFIGSHIVDKLVDNNIVVVIDDESATENEVFHYNPKAEYHKLDICDKESIDSLFENVDYVFHLAAESRIQPAIKNPNRAYNVNVMGTLNILELSKKYNVKRIMYSSTSSVYGMTDKLPTSENDDINCLNPYSHSKFLGEELFRHYSDNYSVDSVIFRYFNVFGERSPIKGQYAPVVGIFLNQYKNGLELTITGDGSKKRDFIHVSDVADANILAMQYDGKLKSKVINIGCGENISINDIAKQISSKTKYIPAREGEVENTLANIKNAEETLNFRPKIELNDWIKNNL